jgi:hypothetical protein
MVNLLALNEIVIEVNNLARLIKAPKDLLPTYGYSRDFANPLIEVDRFGYHYVIIERGQELDRKTTNNLDQLLYWVFDSITFNLALKYELEHRIEEQDCRRIMFVKQEALLEVLNPEWSERSKKCRLTLFM